MRSRNIKPNFFLNEDLAELSHTARLLFIGLWCFADKEGRFEWRPLRIKAAIFPYDEKVDIKKSLAELSSKGLIIQYGNDNEFGCVPKFSKHQRPHVREAESIIPKHQDTTKV